MTKWTTWSILSIMPKSKNLKKLNKIRKSNKKIYLEDIPLSPILESSIEEISRSLSKQIDKELFNRRHARTVDILKLIGTGVFLTASIAIPNLPRILQPFLKDENKYEIWKRFNIPYLKRILKRLEKEKLVKIKDVKKYQVVEITDRGRRRILKFTLDELVVEKPKHWDGKWRLISYDIPKKYSSMRKIFREYLNNWRFYPLHESVFLHAYPCSKQIEFLREYLGIGEYVRFFSVSRIENDKSFRDFFGV